MKKAKITIIGAGPGGATAALFLAKRGIESTLIDKSQFPREKVCGDALSGFVISVLHKTDPALLTKFLDQVPKLSCKASRFFSPGFREVQIQTQISGLTREEEAYLVRRYDFDNFLISEIKENPLINFVEGVQIDQCTRSGSNIIIKDKNNRFLLETELVIFANNIQQKLSGQLTRQERKHKRYFYTQRAYFKNVEFEKKDNIEIYFLKELLPGYLWIFPAKDNRANVGLGSIPSRLKKINIQEFITSTLENHPYFSQRFANAQQLSPWKGMKIPFTRNFEQLSGDGFMQIGDAAYLANPITGEGIGQAMYSGMFAAMQAIEGMKTNNFSANTLSGYDEMIRKKFQKLNKHYFLAYTAFRNHFFVNTVFRILQSQKIRKKWMHFIDRSNDVELPFK